MQASIMVILGLIFIFFLFIGDFFYRSRPSIYHSYIWLILGVSNYQVLKANERKRRTLLSNHCLCANACRCCLETHWIAVIKQRSVLQGINTGNSKGEINNFILVVSRILNRYLLNILMGNDWHHLSYLPWL